MSAARIWLAARRSYGPYLVLSPYLFVALFPFYWMVITTFKQNSDLYNLTTAPFWFEDEPTLGTCGCSCMRPSS